MKILILVVTFAVIVNGDMYLHNPRGSNNRLDENTRERTNPNRMFDSQNNNRGGYNVGSLYYYSGSVLPIEWTNQHSCGDPNNNCEIIIQYMCGKRVRDGTTTQIIPEERDKCKGHDCNNDLRFGMNEDYDYYKNCKNRVRNKGLFTADQDLSDKNKNTAKHTRQNPAGTRRGYECPEERDYYPYWHPNPWKDIVIMTNDVKRCPYYQAQSANVKSKHACVVPPQRVKKGIDIPITKEKCEKKKFSEGSAKWTFFPAHGIDAPECREAKWSRDNHLGNGKGGFTNKYSWIVPNIQEEDCVIRIRYNISTKDYDSWNTDASANGSPDTKVDIGSRFELNRADAKKRGYLFKNNPVIQILGSSSKLQLRLAINTAQYGRTFQDRSHTFAIRKRPASLTDGRILNLNVRGKRGNIVQVYPAVEYDFVPNRLTTGKGDYIHFQWTGSNNNPANNDGQGQAGSDRSNVLLLEAQRYPEGTPGRLGQKYGHFGNNYPEKIHKTTFLGMSKADVKNLALNQPGQFQGDMNELNDAGTYFDLRPKKITSVGIYFYMCTRNNNFSNRNQKGKITVIGNAIAQKQFGWGGGNIVLNDGTDGVWFKRDSVDQVRQVEVEQWSTNGAERYIKSKGGSVNTADVYLSKYLAIFPVEKLTKDGKTFTVKMKVDSKALSTPVLYYSTDAVTWAKRTDVNYSGGMATFQASTGGYYVVRAQKNVAMIAGIAVGVFVIVVLIGLAIFYLSKPDVIYGFRNRIRNARRGFQSEI